MSAHASSNDHAAPSEAPKARSHLLVFIGSFIRAHVLALSVLIVLTLIYALVGFLLVPYLARNAAQTYVADELGRQLDVGDVRFNPFTFQWVIRDAVLREPNGNAVVAFSALLVNAELASLWQRAIVLKEIRLDDPTVNLIIERGGHINLAELAPNDSPESSDSAAPPRVRIGTLTVANGQLDFEDRNRERPFQTSLAPIHFALRDFRTDTFHRNAYAFSGTSELDERLEWVGAFTVEPIASTGRFSIVDLRAQTIDSYMNGEWPFHLASGTVRLEGSYRMALDRKLALDIQLPNVAIADLTVTEQVSSETAPISLRAVDVRDASLSYERNELSIEAVQVAGAHVQVRREADGSINLMRLFDQDAGENAEPVSSSSAAEADTAKIRLDKLIVTDSSITAEDQAVTPAVKLAFSPVSLSVASFTTDPTARIAVDARVGIGERGRVAAKGTITLEPLMSELALELTDFGLPVLQPYLAEATALTLHSGEVDAKGAIALNAPADTAPMNLRFDGDVRVANLRTTDQELNEDFVKWSELALRGVQFGMNPDQLSIDRIVAREPYARVIIAQDRSLNVAAVLSRGDGNESPRTEEHVAKDPQQSSSFNTRIKSIQVIGGSANFADYSIQPSFATGILDLNGTVVGLSSQRNSRAKVTLEGKVDRYAPVDITGEVNLLSAAKYTDLAMNFRNMELTTFNPYSGKFAGYNISKGKLSTELKYKVEDRKLEAQHHIVVDNLEFGAKTDSKDAAPIPIKLAAALLKDRNGVIDLNLPVAGNLDDPTFRLGPTIWKAFLGLLTKIVTSPFAALGALFGGGEDLAFVDFPAGSAELSATEREKLTKLSRALAQRPQLKLDVPVTLLAREDSDSLARKALEHKVAPISDPSDDRAKRKHLAELETLYKSAAKTAPAYPLDTETESGVDWNARIEWIRGQLVEQLRPDQNALDGLARQRAHAVRAVLLANAEVAPDRVFITNDRPGALASNGVIRMEMKLE